jgi:hypothetical protein
MLHFLCIAKPAEMGIEIELDLELGTRSEATRKLPID